MFLIDTKIFYLIYKIKMLDRVILVNEKNEPIGSEEKLRVHQLGLLHRAFSIFVLRENLGLELLMQKRAMTKYHSGGLWTNTCCGHPRPGESILDAANRRLNEEMGLIIELKEIGSFMYRAEVGNKLIENEVDHVMIGYWNNQLLFPNPLEIDALEWSNVEEVIIAMHETPCVYTIWVKEALTMVMNYSKSF